MKILYTAYSHVDAITLHSLLLSQGVESLILDLNHSTLEPHKIQALGIRIAVPDSQEQEAAEVLNSFLESKRLRPEGGKVRSPGKDGDQCPRCSSRNWEADQRPRTIVSLVISLLFMIPIICNRQVVRCKDCGSYWTMKK